MRFGLKSAAPADFSPVFLFWKGRSRGSQTRSPPSSSGTEGHPAAAPRSSRVHLAAARTAADFASSAIPAAESRYNEAIKPPFLLLRRSPEPSSLSSVSSSSSPPSPPPALASRVVGAARSPSESPPQAFPCFGDLLPLGSKCRRRRLTAGSSHRQPRSSSHRLCHRR